MKNIEWADDTWNPITGCDRDCKWYLADGRAVGCYARTMNDRFHLQPNFNAPLLRELPAPENWRKTR